MDKRIKALEVIIVDLISRCSAMEAMQKIHVTLSFIILVAILSAASIVFIDL